MRHYEIIDWVDYARGVIDATEQTAMESHLDSGCTRCEAMVSAFRQVTQTVDADAPALPEGVPRSVKALFTVHHPAGRSAWSDQPLRSLFDNALACATAASRSQERTARRLLFESDGYTLELSVDSSPDTADTVVRGQLIESRGEPRSYAPVFLVGAGTVTDRALTESQGTFELSGRLEAPCELWLFPDQEHRLRLALPVAAGNGLTH